MVGGWLLDAKSNQTCVGLEAAIFGESVESGSVSETCSDIHSDDDDEHDSETSSASDDSDDNVVKKAMISLIRKKANSGRDKKETDKLSTSIKKRKIIEKRIF